MTKNAELIEERHRLGICVDCGKHKAVVGKRKCALCISRDNNYSMKKRAGKKRTANYPLERIGELLATGCTKRTMAQELGIKYGSVDYAVKQYQAALERGEVKEYKKANMEEVDSLRKKKRSWAYIAEYYNQPLENVGLIEEQYSRWLSSAEEDRAKADRLDMGKVGALRRAGWSYDAIAGEFGTTAEVIVDAIHRCQTSQKAQGQL